MFENVEVRTTDDGRTRDNGYPISSPVSLRLRSAKKLHNLLAWIELKQVAQRATMLT